jgi:hypothetical protein
MMYVCMDGWMDGCMLNDVWMDVLVDESFLMMLTWCDGDGDGEMEMELVRWRW